MSEDDFLSKNSGVYLSQLHQYCGEDLPLGAEVVNAGWLSRRSRSGFALDPIGEDFLREVVRDAWRADIYSTSAIYFSGQLNIAGVIWFCRGNAYEGKYYRAPIFVGATEQVSQRLSLLCGTDPLTSQFWAAMAGTHTQFVNAISEFLSDVRFVFNLHPLEFSVLAVSTNAKNVTDDLSKIANALKVNVHFLPPDHELPTS